MLTTNEIARLIVPLFVVRDQIFIQSRNGKNKLVYRTKHKRKEKRERLGSNSVVRETVAVVSNRNQIKI